MAPVTEIAILPLKSGEDPMKDGNARSIWQGVVDAVLAQDGAQRVFWSTEVETPETFRLSIDWDSLEHNKKYMESATYPPKDEKGLKSILAGPLTVYHVLTRPHPPTTALTAPTTEVLIFYFSISMSTEDQRAVEDGMNQVLGIIEKHGKGSAGTAGGWAVEQIPMPKDPSQTAKVWVSMVGWESVEAHEAFEKTPNFTDDLYVIVKNMKHRQYMTRAHVHCEHKGRR